MAEEDQKNTDAPNITDAPKSGGQSDFEQHAAGDRQSIFNEFVYFLAHNKKWWMIPVLMVLLLVGVLVIAGGSAAAPFIYTLF